MSEKKIDPIRPTDDEAIALARRLIQTAAIGALGTLDPATGAPQVTRVAIATDLDCTPILLISDLSNHTVALKNDPRCSLLVGEIGKGDPLAHPRITLSCKATRVERDSDVWKRVSSRYLDRNPKAKLYAGFGDFSYYRLAILAGALNGGFGKAYNLASSDILLTI